MEHELKTDPDVFDAVVSGHKPFEIRFNDRDYHVNDMLILKKTKYTGEAMEAGKPLEYVGSPLYVYVTYILRGPVYGLGDGWVIMAIKPRDTCQ